MQFDRNLVPRNHVKRIVGLFVAFWLVLACLVLAFVSRDSLAALTVAAVTSPLPPTVTPFVFHTGTPAPLPSNAPTAARVSPTFTSAPSDTPTDEPTTTPVPSPTRFYIIPAQPTALPTPDLPPAAPFPSTCDGPGRMNILLIGIDGVSDSYNRAARSDTVIMVGVNFAAKTANMVSIPRDLWVPINMGQVTDERINTAYFYGELTGIGGPEALGIVLSNTFGLRVDRYVVVNFDSFIQGIDAIGGVDINIPQPLHDPNYPLRDGSGTIVIDFPAGQVHMDGGTALIYARIRHDSSDFVRMRRQQQVLFAARDKLLSPASLPQLPALVQVLMGAAHTNLTLQDMALLGCLAPQVNAQAIHAWVIDGNMVQNSTFPDGAQVLLPNMDAIMPSLAEFNVGQ